MILHNILFVGDIHSNFRQIDIQYESHKNVNHLIQLGDFGIFPKSGAIPSFNIRHIPVYFLPGNYEDWNFLKVFPLCQKFNLLDFIINDNRAKLDLRTYDLEKLKNIPNNLYYCSPGYIEKINNVNVLFLGGEWSEDHYLKIEGVDWFKNEELNPSQQIDVLDHIKKFLKTGETIGLVCAHSAPEIILKKYFNLKSSTTPLFYNEIWKLTNPRHWIFGHWNKHIQELNNNTWFYGIE